MGKFASRAQRVLILSCAALVFVVAAYAATTISASPPNPTATATPVPPQPLTAPTALPAPRGKHTIYVLDVLNGRLISELDEIDADTQLRHSTLTLRYTPEFAYSADGTRLYVLDTYYTKATRGEPQDILSVFDAQTLQIQRDDVPVPKRLQYKVFPVGNLWFFASPDDKYLFVVKYGETDVHELRLTVLDANALQQVAEYLMPSCQDQRVWAWTQGRLLCASEGGLDVLDALTGKVIQHLALPSEISVQATLLSPTLDKWYLLGQGGQVVIVDVSTDMPRRAQTTSLPIPSGYALGFPEQLVFSKDGARLYIGLVPTTGELAGSGLTDLIYVYDTRTWSKIGEIKPADPAMYLAVSNDGTQLYTTNPESRQLTIYDTATFQQSGVLHDLGISPSQILIPPE
ncbi:MAG TPA: hypothetical protein VFD70_29680 [Anaerolineae bacterium]|nr:hypothetical protein [Anaerolineae bacterium]